MKPFKSKDDLKNGIIKVNQDSSVLKRAYPPNSQMFESSISHSRSEADLPRTSTFRAASKDPAEDGHMNTEMFGMRCRTRYLNYLGLWTQERARELSERSADVSIRSLNLKPEKCKSVVNQKCTFEGNSHRKDPSLEAFLLKSKSLPDLQAYFANEKEAKNNECVAESTESVSDSSVTQCSVDSTTVSCSNEYLDPVVMPAKPAKPDIRRRYLSKVGIENIPSPHFASQSSVPELKVRYEKLKRHDGPDVTFEDIVKVIGSLVGLPQTKDDAGSKPAAPCKHCTQLKNDICSHKRVRFMNQVSISDIPVHYNYSNRIRESYWNSSAEIRELVYRNMLEFDAEGYQWNNAIEEEDMYYNEDTNEYIHPAYYEILLKDAAVEDSNEEAVEKRKFQKLETN